MGNKKITDLPSATAVNAGDKVEIVQGGTSKQVDANLLSGSGLSGLTTNKVLKATSSTTAGDSNITDDGITVTVASPNNQNLVVVEDNNLYIQYLGTTNAGGLTYLNTYVDLQHDARVNLNAPSVTKNGVEVATVNDLTKGSDYFLKIGATTFDSRYSTNATAFTPVTNTVGKDAMVAFPLIIEETMTFDRIGAEVTSPVASGVCSLLIYDSVNNVPTNLVLDAGTISVTSATYQEISINKQLTGGLYYLVLWHNGSAPVGFRAMPTAACNKVLGIPSTLGNISSYTRIYNSKVYTTAPLTYDLTGITVYSSNNPIISLRRSA